MTSPFDRVLLGDIVTSSGTLWDGCAAVRGEAAAAGQGEPFPQMGGIRLGADCDLAVLERGRFAFDEASIRDRPEMRRSPYHHGRGMRARVVATVLRGQVIRDGATVLARPGTGRFIRRTTH